MSEFDQIKYWKDQEKELGSLLDSKKIKNIYCIGDCLTAGVGVNKGLDYPSQLQHIMGSKYSVTNLGRTMLKMENLLQFSNLFESKIDGYDNIVCVWAGTNDLFFEQTVQNVCEWYSSFCHKLKNKGAKIIAMSILPRSNITPGGFEENRLLFNVFVKENYNSFAHKFADVGNNGVIGYQSAEKEDLWYNQKDNSHLNELGYLYVAKLVSSAIYDLR